MADEQQPELPKRNHRRKKGCARIAGPVKGTFKTPELRAIKAAQMIEAKIAGDTTESVAAQFNCSIATVYNTMNWAKKQGILGALIERAQNKIAPKALDAYDAVLDIDVNTITSEQLKAHKVKLIAAKEIGYGTGVLSKNAQSQKHEELSLSWYLARRNSGSEGIETSAKGETPSIVDAVDAQLVATRDAAVSDAESSDVGVSEGYHSGDDPQPIGEDGE